MQQYKEIYNLHQMTWINEIVLISIITLIFIIIGRFLANLKIKHKTYKIPIVISVIFSGIIVGVILRAIDPNFSFKLVPHLSMLSIIILFLSFGSMIDFKAFKQYGAWTIILGTLPFFIEWIGLLVVITLITPLYWFEAAIIATLLGICSPGIVGPKLMGNIMGGYEKQESYNETILLAQSIENLISLIVIPAFIIVYKSSYSGGELIPMNGGAAIMVIIAPILLIAIGAIIGLLIGMFIIYVIKPASNFIIKPISVDTTDLSGKELEEANAKNQKSESKSNTLVWVLTFALLIVIYLILQLTLAIGFLLMLSALVSGLYLSLMAEKSKTNKALQGTTSRLSNVFYGGFGCFIIWGFGSMLIDPQLLFQGNDWIVNGAGDAVGIPNIISALIIIVFAIIFRTIGTFFIMSFNSKYTFKQKVYTLPAFLSAGTGGVNNGVAILVILGVSLGTGTTQSINAAIIQQMAIVIGATMVIVLVPIGVFLLGKWQDVYIFRWNSISEGSFNYKLKNTIKEEKITKTAKTTLLKNSKEYWKDFYNYSKINSAEGKEFKNEIKELNLLIKHYDSKLNNANLAKINYNAIVEDKIVTLEATNVKGNNEKIKTTIENIDKKRSDKNIKFDEKIKTISDKLEVYKTDLDNHMSKLETMPKSKELIDIENKLSKSKEKLVSDVTNKINNVELLEIIQSL